MRLSLTLEELFSSLPISEPKKLGPLARRLIRQTYEEIRFANEVTEHYYNAHNKKLEPNELLKELELYMKILYNTPSEYVEGN